ncbi:hypothetical protein [Silvanigrella aquatica]|uniref:Lipoprotein n=1 Tax=Silvanigrella aquatica TaxID=1915309 RepID=A0A1L4CYK7_9BACT|nr:hypothetical protein [Silvanigrella aquatica]APJ03032.1 hypothetical protein AXG55_03525 [Silvanigrella aquatica]
MKLHNSLKLTAMGVGLASIAITGCKKTSDDNKTASTDIVKSETIPQPIKNLMVKFDGDIPLGGCAKYTVTMTDRNGNQQDVTPHLNLNGNLSVALAKDSQEKFTLNHNTAEVCAHDLNNKANAALAAQIGDKATLTVASADYFQKAEAKVIERANVESISTIANLKLKVALGAEAEPFQIFVKNSGELNSKALTSKEGVKLFNEKGQEIALEVVTKYDDTDELKEKLKSYFTFKVPKDSVVGNKLSYYVTYEGKRAFIEVDVDVAAIKKLKLLSAASFNPNLLDKQTAHSFDVIADYTDGTEVNLTKKSDLVGDFLSTRLLNNTSNYATISGSKSEFGLIDNRVLISVNNLNTEFLPVVAEIEHGGIESQYPFYIGSVPSMKSVAFEKTVVDAQGTPNLVAATEIPVGGMFDSAKNCAELTSFKYTLGTQDTKVSTKEEIEKLVKIEVPMNSNFFLTQDNKVCALASAKANDEVEVKVVSLFDDAVFKTFKIKASKPVKINKFVLSADAKTFRSDVVLSANKKSETLSAYYLLSDNSISNEKVDFEKINFEFIQNHAALKIEEDKIKKEWKVEIKGTDDEIKNALNISGTIKATNRSSSAAFAVNDNFSSQIAVIYKK